MSEPYRITQITVNTGETIPHPYENKHTFYPSVTLQAEVIDDERIIDVHRALTIDAELLLAGHITYKLKLFEQEAQRGFEEVRMKMELSEQDQQRSPEDDRIKTEQRRKD